MAIEDRGCAADVLSQLQKAFFLGNPGRGIGGVAEHEPVEPRPLSGLLDRFISRAQSREDAMGILVVGRQQHRGAAVDRGQGSPGIDAELVLFRW